MKQYNQGAKYCIWHMSECATLAFILIILNTDLEVHFSSILLCLIPVLPVVRGSHCDPSLVREC